MNSTPYEADVVGYAEAYDVTRAIEFQSPLRRGGWEITRVAPGGVTFFPNPDGGPAPRTCSGTFSVPTTSDFEGYTFFANLPATGQTKLCADGGTKGYEAFLSGDLLLVQAWTEGKEVVLWASMISGMEIISVGGREVSRKRSFGFSTSHDLSAAGIDADRGVVKIPCTLELHRKGELVARFKHPTATLIMWLPPSVAVLVALVVAWLVHR